ncbi:5055_t:CDS:1, partial [Scutellospora calospora]
QNPLKPGFQYCCDIIQSNIESHLLTAINICYQKVFEAKTEYSSLAAVGFENEDIIQQLITDV